MGRRRQPPAPIPRSEDADVAAPRQAHAFKEGQRCPGARGRTAFALAAAAAGGRRRLLRRAVRRGRPWRGSGRNEDA